MSRLRERNDAPLFLAFRSTTLDIITAYMFGHCINALGYPDFCNPLLLDIQAALPILWVIKAFPWLVPGIALISAVRFLLGWDEHYTINTGLLGL